VILIAVAFNNLPGKDTIKMVAVYFADKTRPFAYHSPARSHPDCFVGILAWYLPCRECIQNF
jgi:hypothetical protein